MDAFDAGLEEQMDQAAQMRLPLLTRSSRPAVDTSNDTMAAKPRWLSALKSATLVLAWAACVLMLCVMALVFFVLLDDMAMWSEMMG